MKITLALGIIADDLLLLDLDGMISGPLTGIASSINYALMEHCYPGVPASSLARFVGPPVDDTFLQ